MRHYQQNLTLQAVLILASLLGILVFPMVSSAEQSTEFWLSPTAQQESATSHGPVFDIQSKWTSKYSDRTQTVLGKDQVVSSLLNRDLDTFGFTLANDYSEKEHSTALAAQFGAWSLYQNMGSGESYSHNSNAYNGLDPYAFHGGNFAAYRYSGTSLGYALNDHNHVQLGETTVYSKGLENRRSRFVDYSNNRLFARYTSIDRGGQTVGHGFDAGMNFGRLNVGYQQLSNTYDVSTKRIRFNWNKDVKNRYWLDFSTHDNAALQDYSDKRVMFTWQRAIGGRHFASHAKEVGRKQSRGGVRGRGVLIGGAVAAAAILASSGSGSQDSAQRVSAAFVQPPQTDSSTPGGALSPDIQAQHNAARIRFNIINPISTKENREYGGYVYQAADGSYATSEPIAGDSSSVTLPDKISGVPSGTFARASYHTHAGFDPDFDSENFSETDLEGDRIDGIDGYLATPAGRFKYHQVSDGQIIVLGTVNN